MLAANLSRRTGLASPSLAIGDDTGNTDLVRSHMKFRASDLCHALAWLAPSLHDWSLEGVPLAPPAFGSGSAANI
jgi:hypothetical protein